MGEVIRAGDLVRIRPFREIREQDREAPAYLERLAGKIMRVIESNGASRLTPTFRLKALDDTPIPPIVFLRGDFEPVKSLQKLPSGIEFIYEAQDLPEIYRSSKTLYLVLEAKLC